ncbi:hypothetical protein [Vibrio sp. 10N.239.312.D08]|uniref:hypothetical protein n=1 Tax=Vibrio sp. 10N.239.312.D08 TaxID=3229978 RepID=UPI003551DD51
MLNTIRSPLQTYPDAAESLSAQIRPVPTIERMFEEAIQTFDPNMMVAVSLIIDTPNYCSVQYNGFKSGADYDAYTKAFLTMDAPFLRKTGVSDTVCDLFFDETAGVPNSLYGQSSLHIHPNQIMIRVSAHQLLPIYESFAAALGERLKFVDIQNITFAIPEGGEQEAFVRHKGKMLNTIYSGLKTNKKTQYVDPSWFQFRLYSNLNVSPTRKPTDLESSILGKLDSYFNALLNTVLDSALVVCYDNGTDKKGYRLVLKTEFNKLAPEVRKSSMVESSYLIEHFV